MKSRIESWLGGSSLIRRRLFLAFAGGALAVLLGMTAAWLPTTVREIRANESELQRVAVLGLREQLRLFLTDKAEALSAEAPLWYLPFQEQDLEQVQARARQFLKREPSIEELSLIDEQGKERVRVSRRETFAGEDLRDLFAEPLFREAADKDIAWGPVQIGKWSEPWLTFAVPLKGLHSAPIGVIRAVTNLRPLWLWTRDFNLSNGGRAFVADHTGRLIAADDAGLVIKGLSFIERPVIRELVQAANPGPMEFAQGRYRNEHGVAVVATALHLPGPDWVVAVEQPESLLFLPIRQKLIFSIALCALGMIASFFFAHRFSARLARPILRLRETVAGFRRGHLDRRAEVEDKNEIGDLAQAFNRMADDLKASYENLEATVIERTRELGALYSAMTPPAASCSLQQMQQAAIERLVAVTGADMGRICVRTESGGRLKSTARHGYPPAACESAGAHDCDPTTAAVVDTGETMILPELSGGAAAPGCIAAGLELRSRAVLPLAAGAGIAGVIDLGSRQAGHFQTDRKDHLQALAHQMSIAIANVDLYEKLRVQTAALERANRLQADFTAMIAHDLRSPLNTILGIHELVADGTFGAVSEDQKKWVGKAAATVRQLLSLVNDFLDVSKIEAGHIELSLGAVDLEALIDSALDSFRSQAGERKIALSKRIDPQLAPLRGDRRRLEQVLTNLLSNAIKFTPPGGAITVGARMVGSVTYQVSSITSDRPTGAGEAYLVSREAYLANKDEEMQIRDTNNEIRDTSHEIRTPRFLELSVQDSGVGIPRAEIGGLFEKYRQTSSGKTSEQKGTGLGLVICKMIVQAHGGTIRVESDENQGARFIILLPAGGDPKAVE